MLRFVSATRDPLAPYLRSGPVPQAQDPLRRGAFGRRAAGRRARLHELLGVHRGTPALRARRRADPGRSIAGFGLVQQQFFPTSTRSELFFEMRLPEGTAIGVTDATAKKGRAAARRRPRYRDLHHLCGPGLAALLARDQPGAAELELRADRHRHQGPRGARTRQGAARTGARRRRAAGFRSRVDRFNFGPPVGFPVQFRVVGPDPMKVRAIAEEVRQVMATDASDHRSPSRLERAGESIRLEVDQDRARALGLTPQDVAQTLQTLLSGFTVTNIAKASSTSTWSRAPFPPNASSSTGCRR